MTFLTRPALALSFGAFMLCAETCNHFLMYAAVQSRRDRVTGLPIQIAAWAFVLSLLSGAFIRELESWMAHAPDAVGNGGLVPLPEGLYVLIIGIMTGVALGALVSSIRARRAELDWQR